MKGPWKRNPQKDQTHFPPGKKADQRTNRCTHRNNVIRRPIDHLVQLQHKARRCSIFPIASRRDWAGRFWPRGCHFWVREGVILWKIYSYPSLIHFMFFEKLPTKLWFLRSLSNFTHCFWKCRSLDTTSELVIHPTMRSPPQVCSVCLRGSCMKRQVSSLRKKDEGSDLNPHIFGNTKWQD